MTPIHYPCQRTQKIFWVSKPIVKTFNLRSLEMITRASSEEATNPRGLVVLNYINMVSIAHLHFVPCDLEIWRMTLNKANLRDLIAATGLVILLKFDPNHRFFSPCDLEIWWMTLENNRAPLLYYIKLCASFQIHQWIDTEVTVRKTLNSGQNWRFFVLCDLEISWMTLENNRAPLLYYTKLCASFQIYRWIQIGVTVRKRSIWVKIGNFYSGVTLKFDGWPCKTIGLLFYATSSFVQHFVAIGEFKLELQSGNTQSGSNLTIFRAVWPWNLMDDLQKP